MKVRKLRSASPKKAPKVAKPNHDKNFMKEADTKLRRNSPMWPMKQKRLSQ
jgi:hypothetical protein